MSRINKLVSKILVVIFVFTSVYTSGGSVFASSSEKAVVNKEQQIIVKYKDINKGDQVKSSVKKSLNLGKLNLEKRFKKYNIDVLTIGELDNADNVVKELRKSPNVEYAQKNYKLKTFDNPVNIDTSDIFSLYEVGQVIEGQECIPGTAIDLLPAWEKTKGSPNIVVGVLDTGIDITHKELAANIYVNPGEIPGNGIDDDGDGYIDDVNGWDFANGDNTVNDTPSEFHGTHIAGIIAAKQDGEGVCGVAPNVKILPLKFINGDTGYTSGAIEAIQYAEAHGVKIINCSWGSTEYNYALEDVIANSGMLFVCASGNDGLESSSYPAGLTLPNVVSVGAVNENGDRASFSNYGSSVHVAAPGVSIISSIPGDKFGLLSGTSMAAGFVSGTAALLASYQNDLTASQIASRIKGNTSPNENVKSFTSSGGIVDAYNSLINANLSNDNMDVVESEEKSNLENDAYYIISTLSSFSSATQEQKDKILSAFGITETAITSAEQLGNSLKNSVEIAREASKYNFTISQVSSLLQQYGDIIKVENVLGNFNRFLKRYLVPENMFSDLKGMLVDSHTDDEIRAAYVSYKVTGLSVNSLLALDNEESLQQILNSLNMQLTGDELTSINDFFSRYNINKRSLLTYMNQNSISVTGINDLFKQYEQNTFEQYAELNNEKIDLYQNGENGEIKREKYFNAPFTYRVNDTENINTNTGELSYQSADLSLAGKNGLDLNIVSRYDSSNAKLYDEDYYISYNQSYKVLKRLIDVLYYSGGGYSVTNTFPWETVGYYGSYTNAYNSAVNIVNTAPVLLENRYSSYNSTQYYPDYNFTYPDVYWHYYNPYEEGSNIYYPTQQIYFNNNGASGYLHYNGYQILSQSGWHQVSSPYYWRPKYQNEIYYKYHYSGYVTISQKVYIGSVYRQNEANIESYSSTSYGNTTKANTYNELNNNLGSGWSLGFSSIENDNGTKYLHLSNGSVYKINITPTVGDSNLEKYTLSDMRLENDSGSYSNGVKSSQYVLIYKDGKKEYFADDGRLLGIQDRFGNTIKFEHTTISGTPVINKITDTANRIVNISYETTTTGKKVVVTAPDNSTIQYILEPIPGYTGEYNLVKKIDQKGRETNYDYEVNSGMFSYFSKSYRDTANYFSNLKEIKYPTKVSSKYTYEKTTGNFGNQGSNEYYRVKSRGDFENGKAYNTQSYSYYNNFTGFGSCNDPSELPTSYTYSTEITDAENTKTKCTFNNKHLKTVEEVKEKGTVLTNRTEYEYDSNKLPVKIIKRLYNKGNGQYMESVENYQYDTGNLGDLIGYWDAQAQRDSSNNPTDSEHKTTVTYNPTYHYAVLKTYKKDAATTIKEENIASSDSKTITYANVYENDMVNPKKKTGYIYDTSGNVTEERKYLDDMTSFISTHYDYTDNDLPRNGQLNGVYVTRKWTEGVADAVGNLVEAKAGNSPGVVDEVNKYDIMGNVLQEYGGQGNPITYEYDSLRRVTKEINPDNTYKEWVYNDSDNTLVYKNEKGYQTKYGYDGFGNQLYILDLTSNQTLKTYEYDGEFKLVKESTNGDKSITTYSYTIDNRISSKEVKDNSGKLLYSELYTYEDASSGGTLNKTTKIVLGDINSPYITTVTYTNKLGQVAKDGRVHEGELANTYKYDYLGNKVEEMSARAYDENWSQPYTTKYDYNYEGKVVKQYDINGDYSSNTYDSLGRLKTVTDVAGNKATTPYSSSYEYDSLNRLVRETIPFENTSRTIAYTIKEYSYDRNGNKIQEKISSNKPGESQSWDMTGYTYNNRNLLTKVVTYDQGNPKNYAQYYYDATGNKVRMYTGLSAPLTINGLDNVVPSTDSDYSVTKYEYDQFNQLKKMTDSLSMEENYSYDFNGNMTGKTDRNGNVTTYIYDGLNRMTSMSVVTPEHSGDKTYTYGFSITGKRTSMSDGTNTTSYQYDNLGRLLKEEDANIKKEYTYDAADNRKTFKLSVNGVLKTDTSYTYDNLNRLHGVSEGGAIISDYSYDANGNRSLLEYSNGNKEEYTYNLDNKLKSLTNKNGSTPVSQYQYSYYLNGNQATKLESISNKTTDYTYDGLGRLMSESESQNGNTTSAISYTYDDYNNRKTMNVAGQYSTSYDYDKNNRLTKETKTAGTTDYITTYQYDNNGNQIYKGTDTVKPTADGENEGFGSYIAGESIDSTDVVLNDYDGLNQLVKTISSDKTAYYTYDCNGLRTNKIVNNVITTHVWDGQDIAMELDGTGNVTNKYIRGINLIAAENGSGVRQYYLYNGHGDVVHLTNTTGTMVKSYEYDAFGNEKNPDSADTNVFRYAGEYYDLSSGTYYLRARYYDPTIGRFISEDSVRSSKVSLIPRTGNTKLDARYEIDDPLSLNLYTYCINNPINRIDPSGHKDEELLAIALADGPEPGPADVVALVIYGGDNLIAYGPEIADVAGKAWNGVSSWATETLNLGSSKPVKTDWGTGFNSFSGLKKYLGSAGDGFQWHHIVEQSQINKSGFDKTYINNTNNVVSLSKSVHERISAYYSSKIQGLTEGKTVRDWLAGKSFDFQYKFGLDVIKRFKSDPFINK